MQATAAVGRPIAHADTVSRDIRTRRTGISPDIKQAFHQVFVARQDLARKLSAQILTEGEPEQESDSTLTCRHFRHRRGEVSGEPATAQVHTHEAGVVIRFWVFGPKFDVRVRDLVLLALPKGEPGFEVWLDDGDKIFPHAGGKYDEAGRVILQTMMAGR